MSVWNKKKLFKWFHASVKMPGIYLKSGPNSKEKASHRCTDALHPRPICSFFVSLACGRVDPLLLFSGGDSYYFPPSLSPLTRRLLGWPAFSPAHFSSIWLRAVSSLVFGLKHNTRERTTIQGSLVPLTLRLSLFSFFWVTANNFARWQNEWGFCLPPFFLGFPRVSSLMCSRSNLDPSFFTVFVLAGQCFLHILAKSFPFFSAA